jgi:hypothetical protein
MVSFDVKVSARISGAGTLTEGSTQELPWAKTRTTIPPLGFDSPGGRWNTIGRGEMPEPKFGVHVHVYAYPDPGELPEDQELELREDPVEEIDAEWTDTYDKILQDERQEGEVEYYQFGFWHDEKYFEVRVYPKEEK